ncbi:hypothetical protein V1520DRAFT_358945, partial [Lipomyces starkeyi]
MLLRGNNRREIEPADLYLLPLENEGPTKCKVLVILLCNGKTNQHGQHVLSIEKLKSKESNYKAYYKDWKWLI